MKISQNLLYNYIDRDALNISTADLVEKIGARLVEIEEVVDETHKYDNIFVAKIVQAEKIPDTHLTLCQIDCGKPETVQVVCGAPNAREGILVAWIAPGAIVPASIHDKEPFVIGTRKMLKKYDSHGMLASLSELDFGETYAEGILEIPEDLAHPGDTLAKAYQLDDIILDIDNKSLTHRPDCFGVEGFAREVQAIVLEDKSVPDSIKGSKELEISPSQELLDISIQDSHICERYSAAIFDKAGDRPHQIYPKDIYLVKSGMRLVSPIVDAANFTMIETGQPLHTFDYDKFCKVGGTDIAKIGVRLAKPGEKLTLIDDREIALVDSDIVITSNDIPVALAGAMGGKNTEVDENTKRIIVESAVFNFRNLRKTQMQHGIFSEAITRFTKNLSPYQTLKALNNFGSQIKENYQLAAVADIYSAPATNQLITVAVSEINSLLGTNYDTDKIINTLKGVDFAVSANGESLSVVAPDWRRDIHIKEDIIEEIGRILGYDNIKSTLPKHSTAESNHIWGLKSMASDILASFGANEVLTYGFVSENLLKKASLDPANSYKIINSISPDLQLVRQSIVPSLLDKAFINQKIPHDQFALFEINKVYQKSAGLTDENVPAENTSLALILAERKSTGPAFYRAKFFAEKLLEKLGIATYVKPLTTPQAIAAPFEPKCSAELWSEDTFIGVVGEFKTSVRANFKLAEYLAGFELDFDTIARLANSSRKITNNFAPKKHIDETITAVDTYEKALQDISSRYPSAAISPVSVYQPQDSTSKNITFRVEYND